ncbi:MAG: hypothetical protein P9L92_02275 [Candidatus Electryonea clarkiae]|nr:hypothetical protein [Candidatus Electryonea clarkiae]MDP8289068.1 hypothetical protein [Candidatus Electryonea clarkiae]
MISFNSKHTFHIPVMGTGFTIDSPLRVAKYGISSVISLVDDVFIEQMRKFTSEKYNEPYEAITKQDEDIRANRITHYLNLINKLVQTQVENLKNSSFSPGSDIVRYFELLPDIGPKRLYQKMLTIKDSVKRIKLQESLRSLIEPGSIDVNIMTKLDKDNFRNGQKNEPEYADAMSALRGFAQSNLRASIVFSAGMNQRLYSYISKFKDFFPDENGEIKKKVILKVSDYRSAEIQGKFLAKRGIWVSEYRVESGLNCGGHAFPTVGLLLGPILDQFKNRKQELIEKLFSTYKKVLAETERIFPENPPATRFTVQGGIGTYAENELMLKHYGMDSTGWGTPFLLVPEVTNVDKAHLDKLSAATEDDVHLSDSSPLGVPFWNLRNSGSEEARRQRISDGKPGSLCPKGFLVSNSDYTKKPICLASRAYQNLKLKSLPVSDQTVEEMEVVTKNITVKSCICHDLSGSATKKYEIDKNATPALCCGPNIENFSIIATLEEIVGHIYGRNNLMTNPDRPHMFIKELSIYVDYFRKEFEQFSMGLSNRKQKYLNDFKQNIFEGIEYYRQLAETFVEEEWSGFLDDLKSLYNEVEAFTSDAAVSPLAVHSPAYIEE